MATVKVLLLNPVNHLGGEGESVSVKAGYARNFLLPKGWAIPVNRANRKQIESLQKAREIREAKELEHAHEMSKRLKQVSLAIAVKTGEEGKLFGSVTTLDIYNRIKEEGIELDKTQIRLPHPVKTLGKHTFKVKLHKDVMLEMALEVVSENPIEA